MLQLNDELAPFDRKAVRQAVDLAIDKKRLVATVLLGSGVVATPGFFHLRLLAGRSAIGLGPCFLNGIDKLEQVMK